MLKFKFIIVLSVLQVSSTWNPLFTISKSATARKQESGFRPGAYNLVAITTKYVRALLNPFEDEEESSISDLRWSARKSFNATKHVAFYLHTRSAPDQREQLRLNDVHSLRASRFNATHPTRFIIYGWLGSEYAGVFFSLTPAYFRNGNYNVILVDWGKGAIADYTTAGRRVKSVGILLGKFVDFLHQETGTPFKNIHLIGFSMGAHIAGIAGKHVKDGRIPVIYGLDPALPMFSYENTKERLTNNDADYVEVIHTNAGGYGYEQAIGHVDFYVNYGNYQPGCILEECNHFRAFKVFAESINSKIGFWAKGCDPSYWKDILENRRCYRPTMETALLGGNSTQKHLKGVYYLTTNYESPFAEGLFTNKNKRLQVLS